MPTVSPDFLRHSLTVYSAFLLFAVFIFRPLMVRLKYGVAGIKFKQADPQMALCAFGLKLVISMDATSIVLQNAGPSSYQQLGVLPWGQFQAFIWVGWFMLLLGFVLITLGQHQMHAAWRIGLDPEVKTDLVRVGLFRISRNPIYLGIGAVLTGFFLTMPNGLTLSACMLGLFVLQITVLGEEKFLRTLHSTAYDEYCKAVRRWL
jgi:protein-S-isoprenylcysteine O-methyltransferase Ste14